MEKQRKNVRERMVSAGLLRPNFIIKINPMNPREALLALNLLPEVGPVGVRRLLEQFGDASAILRAPERALMEVDRIGPKVAGLITRWENHVDLAGEVVGRSAKRSVGT